MISVIAQERLMGFTLGAISTAAFVLYQNITIHNSISHFTPHSQVKERISHKRPRLDCAHLWNKTVDQTLGPAIESLSSRGW